MNNLLQPDDVDDQDLIAGVANRDSGAFQVLYRRHAGWLLLRLARRCADTDLVDEVVQDTFVAVWRKAGSYEATGEVGAWLWGIAMHCLVGKLRSRRPLTRSLCLSRASDISAEERFLLNIEYGDLGEALNRLSPELRAVIQATVLDGLTTREAANLLDIPAGTVKTRLMRARATLRRELV